MYNFLPFLVFFIIAFSIFIRNVRASFKKAKSDAEKMTKAIKPANRSSQMEYFKETFEKSLREPDGKEFVTDHNHLQYDLKPSKFCEFCGTRIDDESIRCPNCKRKI